MFDRLLTNNVLCKAGQTVDKHIVLCNVGQIYDKYTILYCVMFDRLLINNIM